MRDSRMPGAAVCALREDSAMTMFGILAAAALVSVSPAPGIYSNEQDRYFAQEAGRGDVPDWLGIEIGADRRWRKVDAFGTPLSDWSGGLLAGARAAGEDKVLVEFAPGKTAQLSRGQPWRCWVSLLRAKPKPDGSPDWSFAASLAIHDQGGRIAARDADAPGAVLRLRQVIWPPPSRNKPSLVLYVHRPDEPDRAVAYAWADPQARLLGLNLRWIQGSCSREEAQR